MTPGNGKLMSAWQADIGQLYHPDRFLGACAKGDDSGQ